MSTRREFLKTSGLLIGGGLMASSFFGCTAGKSSLLDNAKVKMDDGDWDVIIVGGGPGGCAAAISAAREGAKVLVIEATGQLGGMATIGMVPAFTPFSDGEKMIYRGIAEKIFWENKKAVPHEPWEKLDWVSINPENLMKVYDRMVEEAGAEVLFFSRVAAVEKSADDTLEAVIVANNTGLTAFRAKVFIDATGDGVLAYWAGAEAHKGDEKGRLQASSLCFAIGNVDMTHYWTGGNLSTDNPDSPIHDVIKSKKYEHVVRHMCLNPMGPSVIEFNAGHIDLDTTDPWQVSKAMKLGRRIAEEYLCALKDIAPKTYGNAFVIKTASALGVRDSRRIIGDYILTQDDWIARRTFEDEIGRNCYWIDCHTADHVPMYYSKGDSHGIPYRVLTPKGLRNVLTAGRCVSTDSKIFGSMRIMPACLVTGEAAGMAAAHAIQQNSRPDVHTVDTDRLRKRLREEGQYFL